MKFSKVKAALLGAGLICAAAAPVAAFADPITGTFDIKIYQGYGNGTSTSPVEQANLANPLFGTTLVADVTYTGALNFASNATNTLAAFLSSAGGSYTGLGSAGGNQLSTGGFQLTSLFSITGISPGATNGYVAHDDGASLYQFGSTVFDSSPPTTVQNSSFSLANGAFNLVYVEANGLPADLTMQLVPEPASVALLGFGLLGLYMLRRQKYV